MIRRACVDDIDWIKRLADEHRDELGFVIRSEIERAVSKAEVFVEPEIGFVVFHHRRDSQTTLYLIAVREKRKGIGKALVMAVIDDARRKGKEFIQLKCPVNLPANEFYKRLGFVLERVDEGKRRKLNVWRYYIDLSASPQW